MSQGNAGAGRRNRITGVVWTAAWGPMGSGDVDGLGVHEFAEAEGAQFAAPAGVADSAEGKSGVGSHAAVDEAIAGLEAAGGDFGTALGVGREQGGAEAEAGAVREVDGLVFAGGGDDGCDGPEGLLLEHGHAWRDVGEDCGRVEESWALGDSTAGEARGACGDGSGHLGMEFGADVGAGEGAEGCRGVERVAEADGGEFLEQEFLEFVADGFDDDESFGGDATLAAIDQACLGADACGVGDVGVAEHDVRVVAAEFEHCLPEGGAGDGGDVAACGCAAGERDGLHGGVGDDSRNAGRIESEDAEHAGGEFSIQEDILEGEGATGHIGGVFEDDRVSCEDGRDGGAHDLPEGEVPGHDGEDDSEGFEGHETTACLGGDGMVGKEGGGDVGLLVAAERAFFDFGLSLGDGFSHLDGGDVGEVVGAGPEGGGELADRVGALTQAHLAPGPEAVVGASEDQFHLGVGMLGMVRLSLAGGGIRRDEMHVHWSTRTACGRQGWWGDLGKGSGRRLKIVDLTPITGGRVSAEP